MRFKPSHLIAVSIAFACTTAFPATVWKNGIVIRGVQTLSDGGFLFFGPPGTDPTCFENGTWFQVSPNQNGMTAAGVKSTLAVVLIALSTSKPITFAHDNATGNCYVASVVVYP